MKPKAEVNKQPQFSERLFEFQFLGGKRGFLQDLESGGEMGQFWGVNSEIQSNLAPKKGAKVAKLCRNEGKSNTSVLIWEFLKALLKLLSPPLLKVSFSFKTPSKKAPVVEGIEDSPLESQSPRADKILILTSSLTGEIGGKRGAKGGRKRGKGEGRGIRRGKQEISETNEEGGREGNRKERSQKERVKIIGETREIGGSRGEQARKQVGKQGEKRGKWRKIRGKRGKTRGAKWGEEEEKEGFKKGKTRGKQGGKADS